MKQLNTKEILGLRLTTSSKEEILEYIFDTLDTPTEKLKIFTPNPEMMMYAKKHAESLDMLSHADINLPDGVGLALASLVLEKVRFSRIPGADFMELLCSESVKKAATIGFLGGRGSVALETAKCLQQKYPGLRVSFVGEEWKDGEWIPTEYQKNLEAFEEHKKSSSQTLTPRIQLPIKQSIDILFVAFGFPKQEEWITQHIDEYPFRVGMGVGGAFDYLSGRVSRAPKLVRTVGLEWLYRLARQPWRLKRQLALVAFIRLVLNERASHTS